MRSVFSSLNYNLEKLLKTFLFFWLLLCLYRILFMIGMNEYITQDCSLHSVATAVFNGAKLSLQTAGALSLFMLVSITAESIFHRLKYFRCICSFSVIFFTTLLFVARFPFYRQFHSGFNQMLFTALHEDMYALFMSMVDEFHLPFKMAVVFLISFGITHVFNKWFTYSFKIKRLNVFFPLHLKTVLLVLCTYIIGTLSLYGGGWSWKTGVNWENSGVTDSAFLNESILDDYQAIYRAYANQMRMDACNGLSFTAQDVTKLALDLTGKDGRNDLSVYLAKNAQGGKIEKPKHIFVIVSESYANWPLLDKYGDLHIADSMKNIIKGNDAIYTSHMLPSGSSTVGALMTMVTGLANSNLYLTTMPEALEKPYLTAAAPQMKKLGYITNFWYSGPATWENIQEFCLAQGFDNFYSRGNIDEKNAAGSVWGADDEYLYQAVFDNIDDSRPSFSVILNTSNHSPFNVDLNSKGFNAETVKNALPPDERNNQELIKQLGHFWYADKAAGDFITKVKAKYPDSLFIFIGDHADRYNIDKTPSMYEQYAVPFIITGKGIDKNMLPQDAAGSHIDVMPTVIELIAPKDFVYYSVGKSMFENKLGENYGFWITADAIGSTGDLISKPQFFNKQLLPDETELENYINAVRAVSWWLGKYGAIIDSKLLQQ